MNERVKGVIMSRKFYEVKNGEIKITLEQPDRQGKLSFKKLELANGKVFYMSPNYTDNSQTGVYKYVESKLFELAKQELQEYIKANINNYSFYNERHPQDKSDRVFWGHNMWATDEMPVMELRDYNYEYDEIMEGIFKGQFNGHPFKFDFKTDSFIELLSTDSYRKECRTLTPLEVMFDRYPDLKRIIAIEQYKAGKAHPAFTEIVNLNLFLKDKKSIKIHLKDKRVIEYKNDRLSFSLLFDLDRGHDEFVLNYIRFNLHRDSDLSINNIDFLQYGRNQYRINTENLKI
jgi:hypothetical protein